MTIFKPCEPQPPCALTDTKNVTQHSPQSSPPQANGASSVQPVSPKMTASALPNINDVFERLDQKLGGSRYYGSFQSLDD